MLSACPVLDFMLNFVYPTRCGSLLLLLQSFKRALHQRHTAAVARNTSSKVVRVDNDEEFSQTHVPCGLVHPMRWYKVTWDLFICTLIMYVCLQRKPPQRRVAPTLSRTTRTPCGIISYSAVTAPLRFGFDFKASTWLLHAEYSMDIMFFVDIVISFFTV